MHQYVNKIFYKHLHVHVSKNIQNPKNPLPIRNFKNFILKYLFYKGKKSRI